MPPNNPAHSEERTPQHEDRTNLYAICWMDYFSFWDCGLNSLPRFYCSSKAFGHLGVNIFPEEPFGEWTYLLETRSSKVRFWCGTWWKRGMNERLLFFKKKLSDQDPLKRFETSMSKDPGSMFFELLPKGSSSKFAIPAWEAEVGACYELVVTSSGGLCRCKIGDTILVHAMYGKMPIVSLEKRWSFMRAHGRA